MNNIIEFKVSNQIVLISKKDAYLIDNFKWYLIPSRQKSEKYYIVTYIGKKTTYLHRIIMGATKGDIVDHKNKNPLDNTRGNLQMVTLSYNKRNSTVRVNKKGSKFIGVYLRKDRKIKPYYSSIQKMGQKSIYLGSFETELEASEAYNKKVEELFGIIHS